MNLILPVQITHLYLHFSLYKVAFTYPRTPRPSSVKIRQDFQSWVIYGTFPSHSTYAADRQNLLLSPCLPKEHCNFLSDNAGEKKNLTAEIPVSHSPRPVTVMMAALAT